MRILLITQYFLPEPQKLLAELATTLSEFGHSVSVLTGYPHWPAGKLYPGYRVKLWQSERIDGVTVYRAPIYPDHSGVMLKRVWNIMSLALSCILIAPWRLPRHDIVHVVSPPMLMMPGWVLSRLWRVPMTYEIQDMWPETLSAVGMIRNRTLLRILGAFLKLLYRRAARIRVISPGFVKNLEEKGVPRDRVEEISNWVDTDYYRDVHPSRTRLDPRCRGKFNVMFAGNIGLAQGVEVVLRAAQRLKDLADVNFVLVGDGVELDRLKAIQEAENIDNVVFAGRYPPAEMSAILAEADVVLVHLRDDPLFRMTIPLKTLTYLATGRPIIAAIEGDVAEMVKQAGAGITCPPSNPDALAAAVRRLYAMAPELREQMGRNGRTAACTKYARIPMVRRIENMLLSAARGLSGPEDAKTGARYAVHSADRPAAMRCQDVGSGH